MLECGDWDSDPLYFKSENMWLKVEASLRRSKNGGKATPLEAVQTSNFLNHLRIVPILYTCSGSYIDNTPVLSKVKSAKKL